MINISHNENYYFIHSSYWNPDLKSMMEPILSAKWDRNLKSYMVPRSPATSRIIAEHFNYVDDFLPGANGLNPSHIKTPLWDHQKKAVSLAVSYPAYMLALDMGTGKSLCAVAVAGEIGAILTLILCPKSVVNVWPRQFAEHSTIDWRVVPLVEKSVIKKERTIRNQIRLHGGVKPLVFICNYDSIWREPLAEFVKSVKFDLLIMDESQRIKSHAASARAAKFIYHTFYDVPKKLALSGSPMPHSPLDLFSQYRALDDGIFGTYFGKFRSRYCVMGGYNFHQVVGYKNQKEFQERMRLISFHVKKEDCLDLPPEVDETIELELGDKLKKDYKKLEDDFFLQVKEGIITASNAVVKMMRLRQFLSGFAKVEGQDTPVFVHDLKRQALMDILQDTQEKVTVFCNFKYDLEVVRDVSATLSLKYGELSGNANDLNEMAQYPEDLDVLGVQIQSGGVGVDLSRSSVAVYYSLGLSLGDYLQSKARLHRPGQKNKVTFIHLLVKGTLDTRIYKALLKRHEVIKDILEGE